MEKLKKFLKYTSENNKFYSNIINEYNVNDPTDISQYPILTRKQLQLNRHKMFSDSEDANYYAHNLIRTYSSGTSGTPINVYWKPDDYFASTLTLWRLRNKYYGIKPYSKRISFTYTNFNVHKIDTIEYKASTYELSVLNSSLSCDDSYYKLINIISEYKPEWLYIQPSILAKLVYYYKKSNMVIPSNIKYIESIGEILSDSLKREAQDFFNVPIANMYGSEEMNAIAYECPFHTMHVMNDNVYLECLLSNGNISKYGKGESIITNMHNTAMPLVRYNQGDLISVQKPKTRCPCGQHTDVIESLMGRTRNSFRIGNTIVSEFFLVRVIDIVNNELNSPIEGFHYDYYPSTSLLKCSLLVKQEYIGWGGRIKDLVKNNIKTLVDENLNIETVIYERFPEEYTSKKNLISINE